MDMQNNADGVKTRVFEQSDGSLQLPELRGLSDLRKWSESCHTRASGFPAQDACMIRASITKCIMQPPRIHGCIQSLSYVVHAPTAVASSSRPRPCGVGGSL